MWVDWLAKALDHSGMLRVELDVDEREEGGSRRGCCRRSVMKDVDGRR
jgi:hypothetical protein